MPKLNLFHSAAPRPPPLVVAYGMGVDSTAMPVGLHQRGIRPDLILSAGKKLLDTTHPAFKAVTAIKGRIIALWKSMSLPYPEPGIRLIRQDQIETFNAQIESLKEELDEAVRQLDQHFAE